MTPIPLNLHLVSRRLLVRTAGLAVASAVTLPLPEASAQEVGLATDATPAAGPAELLWESSGDPASPLGNPAHLAIAPDGNIWVADGDNHRFVIFAPDGSVVDMWGTKGSGQGEINFTTSGWGGYYEGAIAFDADGAFYITEPGNHRVQKFGPDRKFLVAWGTEGRKPGQFHTPIDVVVDAQGQVYVLDSYRHDPPAEAGTGAVQVFDPDGRFLSEWGTSGSEPGQLKGPFGIGLDSDGTLLVAEFDNNRVQRFTPEGKSLHMWGEYGMADGQFIWPMDAAVDAERRVFVTDYSNNRVQVFGSDGRFLAKWGKLGIDPGEFGSPLGVALGSDGIVYVTDAAKRLQAFRIGALPDAASGTRSPRMFG